MIKDLAGVNRTLTPWLVVGGHRPFYIDSTNNLEPDGDQPVARALRDALEDAFYEYQVLAACSQSCSCCMRADGAQAYVHSCMLEQA